MPSDPSFEPRFLATAIGSVPYGSAEEAVDLILSLLPEGPFWPQLSRVDWHEGMMVQYTEGLPGATYDEAREKVTLDIETATFALEEVDAAYAAGDTTQAGISQEFSRGFSHFCERVATLPTPPRVLKGHVTGPVTQALALETSYEERAAIYEPELARMVARWAGLKARLQEEAFERAVPDAQKVIFFDEPSMGSIGSAVLNLDADLAVELLSIAANACRGLPGIHCCGETDLGLIADAGVKVLNFDAYEFVDALAAAGRRVRTFVEDGGMLAIGLVPSSLPHPEAILDETADSLWARLLSVVDTLTATGLDRDLLARRSMLTPSCGTGGMTPELARRSLELTGQIAARAREHFL